MAVKSSKDLFRTSESAVHPRLRRWQRLRSSGYSFDLEIHRKWDGLTFSPAKMFVTPKQHPGDPGVLEEVLWEDELNQGLVELGVKASAQDEEVSRYALVFKSAFEPVSLRHGQDYLRSVLIEFLKENDDLADHPKLKKLLGEIRVDPTAKGRQHDQALETIESIVKTKAQDLTNKLKYTEEEAFEILACALAQYVDEIFHVSARRFWFPK